MNKGYTEIDGKFYQEAQVVMLPTKNASRLHRDGAGYFYYKDHPTLSLMTEAQHLYFLSDEEIKEGDWVIDPKLNKPVKVTSMFWVSSYTHPHYGCALKKIIATTDSELGIVKYTEGGNVINGGQPIPLSRPSNSFIEKFVSEWNKGNKIDKVLVEFDKKEECNCYYTKFCQSTTLNDNTYCRDWEKERYKLKVAPDNTITIKPLVVDKLEQLANLLTKYDVRKYLNINNFGYSLVEREIVKLFEQNL